MQKGFGVIDILVGVLITALIAGGGYYFYNQNKIKSVNSFEECAAAGYGVMESYPARCATPDGRSFTQVLSEDKQKKLEPPQDGQICIQVITPAKNYQTGECKEFPTPCDVPQGWEKVDSCNQEMPGWKTYKNNTLGVEFKFPTDFSFKEQNNRGTSATTIQDITTFESKNKKFVFEKISSDGSVPPYRQTTMTKNFNGIIWKVSILDQDDKYCDAGDCATIAPSYYFFRDGYKYSFTYYSDDFKSSIEQILSTFKFTN